MAASEIITAISDAITAAASVASPIPAAYPSGPTRLERAAELLVRVAYASRRGYSAGSQGVPSLSEIEVLLYPAGEYPSDECTRWLDGRLNAAIQIADRAVRS